MKVTRAVFFPCKDELFESQMQEMRDSCSGVPHAFPGAVRAPPMADQQSERVE